MRIQSWIAFITYVASLTGIVIGPWDWWINWLVIGAVWAAMFPRRHARRQNYNTLRGYLKSSDAVERAMLAPTMLGLTALWPFTIPFMWILVQGGVFGDRPKKDTIAS